VLAVLGVLVLALPPPAGAAISSIPDSTAAVNGSVLAIAHTSTRTYIGGNFAYVGIPTIGSGGVSASTGVLQNFARVTAGTSVSAVINDGAGGFYIGGTFTAVGGQPVTNLAHINADGSVDTTFLPNPNGTVTALTLSGSSLFVGGAFTTIGGQTVSGLAKLDATTGAASATFTPSPNGAVNVLLVSGTTLYAGGGFTPSAESDRPRRPAWPSSTRPLAASTPRSPRRPTGASRRWHRSATCCSPGVRSRRSELRMRPRTSLSSTRPRARSTPRSPPR
jgi:trimeric autotransporter adhesin